MAGKPKNRLELRRQYEAAEPLDPMEDETEDAAETEDEDDEERRPKKKKPAPKAKPKAPKAAKPAARVRIVWAVVNDAFKTIATFEYNQKEAALAKAAEMTAKGKGSHFLQKVKEGMSDDAPGLGAVIPRAVVVVAPAKVEAVAPVVEDEEEDDDAEDSDSEADDFEDEEE